MSIAAVPSLPAPIREEPARRLRALERPLPRKRPKIVYAIAAVVAAAIVAAAQIALSLAITQDSFVLKDLRIEQRELALQMDAVSAQLGGMNSPQYLSANAAASGMVAAASPGFLRLSDGATFGQPSGTALASTGTGVVGNALVADRLLVVAPETTVAGLAVLDEAATADSTAATTAPPLSTGIPSPKTH